MKKIAFTLFLCVSLSSCFLFSPYRKVDFTYQDGSASKTVTMVVPKGYRKSESIKDSLGNTVRLFSYRKARFYLGYLVDTNTTIQPIIEGDNIPRISLTTGALIYKGMDAEEEFWREVRQKHLVAGYQHVPKSRETRFDSATNYLVVWPVASSSKPLQ
jgi:hypothetical protein